MLQQVWAGVDVGKAHHHCVVIDADGKRLLSRRVANDETELLELIGQVLALGRRGRPGPSTCPTAAPRCCSALLVAHGQQVLYIPGPTVNRAADGYRGEGKTDAKDAAIIADQARMRRGPEPAAPGRRD